MQVVAVAVAVDVGVHVAGGAVLLHQVQQLCVALRPDGLQWQRRCLSPCCRTSQSLQMSETLWEQQVDSSPA